ncbi:hypothetical protein [Brevibacterium album]|uniref:hypothetical protein n=1 Tax=Brevibacterium album TaxID=417948 RepID=UPI0004179622|nr:hypothetical protein [Brevibacterium album]
MGTRWPPLNPIQLKALEWVARGCPEGVWHDSSYKVSVYALATRGLVKVDRRRGSWSAAMTDDGRFYLDHGHYRINEEPPSDKHSGPRGRTTQKASFSVTAEALIADLLAHDGTLTVADPPPEVRAAYRRAMSMAIADGLVPAGSALRHTGRDRGDLVVRLIPKDDAPQRPELAPIPVPDDLSRLHDAVRELRDSRAERLDVTPSEQRRALLILQAIADECERRGHEFGLPSDDDSGTFRLTVDGVPTDFDMLEERVRRPVPNADELAEARYEWQRVRSTVQKVPSGKLLVQSGPSYSRTSWADRKRWTLDSRLPHLFAYAESQAAETLERRARDERERAERQRAWEQAKTEARQRYIEDLNRRRLGEQLESHRRADELLRYAEALEKKAAALDDQGEAHQVRAWTEWARSEAERIDPLLSPADLQYVEPDEVADADLDPFMPRGMTARRPPDDARRPWSR